MKFFEVFDELKADDRLNQLFSKVDAVKIVGQKATNRIVIYIESDWLLPYRDKKKMLSLMKKQLFFETQEELAFHEVYHLSEQYNQKNLWEAYGDSLIDELSERSTLLRGILLSSQIRFVEEKTGDSLHENYSMEISMTESFINQRKGEEIKRFLEEAYSERFGFDLKVIFNFTPVEEKQYDEYEFVSYTGKKTTGSEKSEKQTEAANKQEPTSADSVEGVLETAIKKESENTVSAVESKQETGAAEKSGSHETEKTKADSSKSAETPKETAKSGTNSSYNKNYGGKGSFAERRANGAYNKARFGKRENEEKDPAYFYGRFFDGNPIPIVDIQDEIGEVIVHGKILKCEVRELKNEKLLYIFSITDFTDTISVKLFVNSELKDELNGKLKEGKFVKIKGNALMDKYDHEVSIASVYGICEIPNFIKKRKDTAERKRVELHAHTTFSDMDAVMAPESLVKTAFEWGHPAVAITDHGVVQGFPVANHAIDKKKLSEEDQERFKQFKIIYGMEAYLVDDMQEVVREDKGQELLCPAVVFDIETTGLSRTKDCIIEIGAVKVVNGEITEKFSTFVNPKRPIPLEIEKLTSINDSMVMDADTIDVVLPKFLEFCKGCIMVAHNASFDTGFISKNAQELGLKCDFTIVDTVGMARNLLPDLNNFKLDTVAKAVNVSLEHHHRAVDDAGCTAEIYVEFLKRYKELGVQNLSEINDRNEIAPEIIRKMKAYHTIILCKNETGRVNLYRLVSESHITYFQRVPRIPKSLLQKHREGLIIGSACEAGELFQAILNSDSPAEIDRLCAFYDYYEIQPLGNNRFMIDSPKIPQVTSEDDLIELNKQIIALGEEYGKPVVATCDAHFLNPEDEVYRRIIMHSKGFADADNQAPLYLRTTEEMLAEFRYLSPEKAEEVVIDNPCKIADMIEKISPVRPDKAAPVIPHSDETLTNICYDKAHSIYGPDLPPQVKDRLDHELNSIIKNGFAVMYIIAQKLVWKSNEDGYLVGSRGSVGSSFVATMSGITEVNPLPPHYYCSECHFADFDSEFIKPYIASSGCDMPDRVCPKCGAMLKKDGHNIPFETFLGFNGDKEPDIDLNFSGEYQSKAHEYTEVIFGKGQTFRAGTFGTVAEKTAYGYVKKYNEEHGIHKRPAEIERIAVGCTGVRRSTGQHPGGIIVLPLGEEINSFTPIQHPANDMTTKTVTTHFEYHSIDHNLLKLDILGHDDPTMIRVLEDFTGVDAKLIRMDDPKVLKLFESTESLGIKPSDISGCTLGSLGLPELGTDFVMQMLKDTKPKSFSDMIRISGLSHGTDVWLNNTQTLILEGKTDLAHAICTRDDIMTYLIQMGVESGFAFKIMESVRKGKGLTPEMEEAMLAQGVPDWYIWSCKKIKYMFPKAHACAYVMMAFRIAYFKVYYPLAYYAAYFSIRASAFNYELMCLGVDKLRATMAEYRRRKSSNNPAEKLSDKEDATYNDMKLVEEMYARGYGFEPIDVFKAKAHAFQIVSDTKLMACFSCIDGVGERAAEQIVEAAANGPFLSREDFTNRAKVSQTIADKLAELGILKGIPLTNQISLMDFLDI